MNVLANQLITGVNQEDRFSSRSGITTDPAGKPEPGLSGWQTGPTGLIGSRDHWLMEHLTLLANLSDAFGPPGGEAEVAAIMRRQLEDFCEIQRDGLGSLVASKTGTASRPRLMLAAHLDEIGFMVQAVTASGYLRLLPLGGWDPGVLPGQRLWFKTDAGEDRLGVVASVPYHFRKENKKELKIEELLVDVGANNPEEVKALGLRLGTLAVPAGGLQILNGNRLLNKAWDDRVGVAAMIAVMQYFSSHPHPNTLVAVGTVQEEVGSRGATTAVELVRPDLAIVLEGPPADDYPGLVPDTPQGALGQGVQIRLADPTAIVPSAWARWVLELAASRGIPHQVAVRRTGATDARTIHLARGGIPTLVLGVPVRYAHGPAGLIAYQDFEALVALTRAIIAACDETLWRRLRVG